MDFGSHTFHIVISLAVILTAAGVALVCDLLRSRNEHLRELAVELKVRNDEAERRIQALQKKGKIAPVRQVLVEGQATAKPSSLPKAEPVAVPKVTVAQQAASRSLRPERERRGEMSPAVAAIANQASSIVSKNTPEAIVEERVPVTGRKNWESIINKLHEHPRPQGGELIAFESIQAVPAGFHEASVLQRAVETGRTISGLVVSIGTNELGVEAAASVSEFLRAQLNGLDFGCQSGTDEYVLISAGDQGANAQRRLSAIAEKLWDFQLSTIGGSGVQFSWGSFEARGERIGEAVATAIEQMQETRHARRANIARAV